MSRISSLSDALCTMNPFVEDAIKALGRCLDASPAAQLSVPALRGVDPRGLLWPSYLLKCQEMEAALRGNKQLLEQLCEVTVSDEGRLGYEVKLHPWVCSSSRVRVWAVIELVLAGFFMYCENDIEKFVRRLMAIESASEGGFQVDLLGEWMPTKGASEANLTLGMVVDELMVWVSSRVGETAREAWRSLVVPALNVVGRDVGVLGVGLGRKNVHTYGLNVSEDGKDVEFPYMGWRTSCRLQRSLPRCDAEEQEDGDGSAEGAEGADSGAEWSAKLAKNEADLAEMSGLVAGYKSQLEEMSAVKKELKTLRQALKDHDAQRGAAGVGLHKKHEKKNKKLEDDLKVMQRLKNEWKSKAAQAEKLNAKLAAENAQLKIELHSDGEGKQKKKGKKGKEGDDGLACLKAQLADARDQLRDRLELCESLKAQLEDVRARLRDKLEECEGLKVSLAAARRPLGEYPASELVVALGAASAREAYQRAKADSPTQESTCAVCMDYKTRLVRFQCKHVVCVDCRPIVGATCHICREPFEGPLEEIILS